MSKKKIAVKPKPETTKAITSLNDYEVGVNAERHRIDERIDKCMSYYAETIGVMNDLDCKEGAKAASIALEAIRRMRFDLADLSNLLFENEN